MKKVLIVDPWGGKNTAEYLNGLIYGLSLFVDLRVVCGSGFTDKCHLSETINIDKYFLKHSNKMQRSVLRRLVRGIEYIQGYLHILSKLRCEHYDVIHFNWLLSYKIDSVFLSIIKKKGIKIVYTAHNVIPHINGEKYIYELGKIYRLCDNIIVHGNAVKQEMVQFFPFTSEKIYIQKHGCILGNHIEYAEEKEVPENIREFFQKYEKCFIFFGLIFPNKGIDRVASHWLNSDKLDSMGLIIAGRTDGNYPQLDEIKDRLYKADNILFINSYVEDKLLNYMIEKSKLIILPYRHASMSGVIFTAAQHRKGLLYTECGCFDEYLTPGVDSISCDNNEEALNACLDKLVEIDDDMYISLGENLEKSISLKCDWKEIASGIYENVYGGQQNRREQKKNGIY